MQDIHSNSQANASSAGKKASMALVVVLLLAVTGYGVYLWQNAKIEQLNAKTASMQAEIDSLRQQGREEPQRVPPTTEGQASPSKKPKAKSENERVLAAATANCAAKIDASSGRPFVLSAGVAGTNGEKVVYSKDGIFAKLNVQCRSETGADGNGGIAFIFKKVNDTWVLISTGQQRNPALTRLYGIPEEAYI